MTHQLTREEVYELITAQWTPLGRIMAELGKRHSKEGVTDAQLYVILNSLETCGKIEKSRGRISGARKEQTIYRRVGSHGTLGTLAEPQPT